MPGKGKPFVKGDKRAGRPKGRKNNRTLELNFLTRMAPFIDGEAYSAALQQRVLRGKAPHAENYLFNRLHGRPADVVDDTLQERRPIKIVIEVVKP